MDAFEVGPLKVTPEIRLPLPLSLRPVKASRTEVGSRWWALQRVVDVPAVQPDRNAVDHRAAEVESLIDSP